MKIKLLLAIFGLIAGASYYAWSQFAPNRANGQAVEQSMEEISPYTAVARGKVDVEGGVIEVAARVGGTFNEVLAEEGDFVKKGQVLARQEDDEERIALRSAEASLESARANLDRIQLDYDIAKREYDRLKPLGAMDAVAAQELDRAADQMRQAEINIRLQKASIAESENNLESVKFRLEQRTIRAPVAGRIVEAKVRPGVGASTLQVTSAFTLMPDAQRIVRADLDESFVDQVKVGQSVVISPDARPEETYAGKVMRIGEIFGRSSANGGGENQQTSDNVIEVVIAAGDLPLLIGQPVLARFLKGTSDAQS